MGLLDIHAPLEGQFSANELPAVARSVTPYQLLTHQSGLPRDFARRTRDSDSLCDAVAAAIDWAGIVPAPRYSNVGFCLLAELVARSAGVDFRIAARNEVIAPLEMSDSGFGEGDGVTASKAYGPRRNASREAVNGEKPMYQGALGLWSTPADMCRLMSAFQAGSHLLSEQTRAYVTSTHWGPTVRTIGGASGLGVEVRTLAGKSWFGHSGGAPGFVSATYACHESPWAFSVAFNARALRDLEDVVEALAKATYLFESEATNEASLFEPFAGVYQNEFGACYILNTPTQCLEFDPTLWNPFRSAYKLRYESPTSLRVSGGNFVMADTKLDFVPNSDGNMTGLTHMTIDYERMNR